MGFSFLDITEYFYYCHFCGFKSDKEFINPLYPACGSKLLPGILPPYKDLLRNYRRQKKRNIELLELLIKYDR